MMELEHAVRAYGQSPLPSSSPLLLKLTGVRQLPSSCRTRGGRYPDRYAADEQRIHRPILIATVRAVAVAIWLIFRVAHSSHINSGMLVVCALKISQMTDGEKPGDTTLID